MHGREAEPRGPCPMCGPDSDGFVMNRHGLRVEEGALGDPVLAGNLVLNPPEWTQVTADGPPAANTPPGRLERHRPQALQHGPKPMAGPTARARAGPTPRAKC